jgi:hypothetical protein
MKSAWLGVVRLFYVALLVAHRVFRFEQESVALWQGVPVHTSPSATKARKAELGIVLFQCFTGTAHSFS